MKKIYGSIAIAAFCASSMLNVAAAPTPKFTNDDYKKALWMTGRFYGAQRSGDTHNWLLLEHEIPGHPEYKGASFIKDADSGYDLTGGWFDCGDHVKFGQTEFYSAYMLILGYSEFSAGYEDYYSPDYAGYLAAGNYTWEGGHGRPNGIPDILDELKHATDYFMKVIRDKSTFYYQVGDGDADHQQWVTAPKMSTLGNGQGGEADGPRKVQKASGNVSDMASLCGATLAAMSRLYAPFDPAYAKSCLEKAKLCYDFVNSTPKGGNTGGGSFYGGKGTYLPDMVCMDIEMYRATGEQSYLEAAYKDAAGFMDGANTWNHNWSICYTKSHDLAYYLLAKYGSGTYAEKGKEYLDYYVNMYKGNRSDKLLFAKVSDAWGVLRYPAAQAFLLALHSNLNGEKEVNEWTLRTVEYIMGSNGQNFSYIVGFGDKSPALPHHRNYFGDDGNNMASIANNRATYGSPNYKYRQFGIMVGGSTNDGKYEEGLESYTYSESGIDYNAGLVSALGYINSMLSPVDNNKFGHPTPNLGESQSICGKDKITINSGIQSDGKKTFTWTLNGQQIAKGTDKSSIDATQGGTYVCQVDSAGEWQTEGTVEILSVMPNINLGDAQTLCSPSFVTLDAGVEDPSYSYQWSKDGSSINGATNKTLTVTAPGKYKCTVTATGCPAVSGEVEVDSKLPIVNDVTSGAGGQATLVVENATTDDYEWYDSAENGNLLGTGKSLKLKVEKDMDVYVQDAGAATFVAGPKTNQLGTQSTNWGIVSANFTTTKPISITGMTLGVSDIYNAGPMTVTVTVGTNEYTSNANISGKGNVEVTFDAPIELTAGNYELSVKLSGGAIGFMTCGLPNFNDFQGDKEVIKFVGSGQGGNNTNNGFPALYDWKVTSGSGCDRAKAHITYDALKANITDVKSNICGIYPVPADDKLNIELCESVKGTLSVEIENMQGSVVMTTNVTAEKAQSGINISSLSSGVYVIRITADGEVSTAKFLKK